MKEFLVAAGVLVLGNVIVAYTIYRVELWLMARKLKHESEDKRKK